MANLISIGKIVDDSWTEYHKRFKELMKPALWLLIIPLSWTIISFLFPDVIAFSASLSDELNQLPSTGTLIAFIFVSLIITPLTAFWVTYNVMRQIHLGLKAKTPSPKEFGHYIWISILQAILLILPLLLIIPGFVTIVWNILNDPNQIISGIGLFLIFAGLLAALILIIWLAVKIHFAQYIYVVNGISGQKSIKASSQLIQGKYWKILIRILIPKLLFSIPVIIAQIILMIIFGILSVSILNISIQAGIKIEFILQHLVQSGIGILSIPIFILADYILFKNLK